MRMMAIVLLAAICSGTAAAAPTTGPTSRPTTGPAAADLSKLQGDLDRAEKDLADSKAVALRKLEGSPEYKAAKADDAKVMRAQTIIRDPDIRRAQDAVERAALRLGIAKAAAERVAAAAEAEAESDRMKDPIYRAVKEHKIVVGMTLADVEKAMGVKPTETTKSSDAVTFGVRSSAESRENFSVYYNLVVEDGKVVRWERETTKPFAPRPVGERR